MAMARTQATEAERPREGGDTAPAIGQDLRALRKSKGLTLAELALRVRRSVGYLSQVERGLSEMSISDLRRVAAALDVPLGWFFAHDAVPAAERGYVVRADARRRVGNAEDGLTEELLSPDLGGAFEIFRSEFAPGAELPREGYRETEEAGYVVAGELEVWIGGRHFHLRTGDSFRFDHETYRWRNPGAVPAVLVWVIAPPVY